MGHDPEQLGIPQIAATLRLDVVSRRPAHILTDTHELLHGRTLVDHVLDLVVGGPRHHLIRPLPHLLVIDVGELEELLLRLPFLTRRSPERRRTVDQSGLEHRHIRCPRSPRHLPALLQNLQSTALELRERLHKRRGLLVQPRLQLIHTRTSLRFGLPIGQRVLQFGYPPVHLRLEVFVRSRKMLRQFGGQLPGPLLDPHKLLPPGPHLRPQPPQHIGSDTPSAPTFVQPITFGLDRRQRLRTITGSFPKELFPRGCHRLQLGRVITGRDPHQRLMRDHLRPQLLGTGIDLLLQPLEALQPRLVIGGLGVIVAPASLQRGPFLAHPFLRGPDPLLQTTAHPRLGLVERVVVGMLGCLQITANLPDTAPILGELCLGIGEYPGVLVVDRGDSGLRFGLQLLPPLLHRMLYCGFMRAQCSCELGRGVIMRLT
ncbi:hypothetical protein ACFWF7_14700 [Nocardia sp. NPDC060256]|uniref:hypothetical protein n=1 Tax=Nocardia sp. NPDC060256 TaxID=3347086 RepID=UPI00365683FB